MTRRRVVASAALLLWLAGAVEATSLTLPSAIPDAERARLEGVAHAAAVSTRVDADPFPGRPEVFQFLLDHPEFASRVTRVLKVARYRIWREADGLHLDDGWGAIGRFDVVHATPSVRVMYARGVYRKRPLPDIHGEAVVTIEYGVRPAADGTHVIAATVSGFVKFDSAVVSAATKLATPVAKAKADREARTLVKVFAKVSRAVDERPAALVQDLAREPDVDPGELAQFRKLLGVH
jgi:hypothetical protein